MDINYKNKISAKSLGFDKDEIRSLVAEGAVKLFIAFGIVTAVKTGDGDNGPWTKFIGQFEAVNTQTGEVFRSGELFLPNSVTPLLESQVVEGSKEETFAGLQFSIEVGAHSSDTAIGYEFDAKDLMGVSESDPLLAMRNKFAAPTPEAIEA